MLQQSSCFKIDGFNNKYMKFEILYKIYLIVRFKAPSVFVFNVNFIHCLPKRYLSLIIDFILTHLESECKIHAARA